MANPIGNELVQVIGVTPTGGPAGTSEYFTTEQIAGLASATPGGTTGQVQINNAGSFGGITNTQLSALIPTAPNSVGGAGPYKPQIVTTRNGTPFQGVSTIQGNPTTRIDMRFKTFVGPSDITDLQFAYAGFVVEGASGEIATGNDVIIDDALENSVSTTFYPVRFSGSNLGNVINGTAGNFSDLVPVDFAAGSFFWDRRSLSLLSPSFNYPFSFSTVPTAGDQSVISNTHNSQTNGIGSLVTPPGGVTNFNAGTYGVWIGIPKMPVPAALIIGDSIAAGFHDAGDAFGSAGWIQRGLESVGTNNYPLPWLSQACPSSTYSTFLTGYRMRQYWPYTTHALIAVGTNDLFSGASLATLQANLTTLVNSLKKTLSPYGKRLQVGSATLTPRTTSTDSWATLANQTAVSGYGTGGIRDQFNAWLFTQVGTLIDYVVDPNPYIESQTNHGLWIVNGTSNYATSDGLHPSSAACALAAAAANAWAVTLTP